MIQLGFKFEIQAVQNTPTNSQDNLVDYVVNKILYESYSLLVILPYLIRCHCLIFPTTTKQAAWLLANQNSLKGGTWSIFRGRSLRRHAALSFSLSLYNLG
jgi:hypothetical protein